MKDHRATTASSSCSNNYINETVKYNVPQIKPTKVYKPQSFHWFLGQLLTFYLQLKAKKWKEGGAKCELET